MVLSAFTEDASFDHLWQGKVKGHAAILKNMEDLWYSRYTGSWVASTCSAIS
jgi:hypothetical protein